MSGPVRPPLKTELSTGASSNRPVNTIAFDSSDFTLTNSSTKTTVTLASGSGSASLTDTHIGFGSASNLLTGSANFTFTQESGGNGPAVLLTGDKPVLKLQDDTDATTYRAEFLQSGASQYINIKDSTGTNNEMFRIAPNYVAIQRSMDAEVGIGTVPDSNVTLHVQKSALSATETVKISNTAVPNTTNYATSLVFDCSGTPTLNASRLGRIDFNGKDSAGNDHTYVRMGVIMADKGTGSEDGLIKFEITDGGTDFIEHLTMGNGNVIVNEDQVNVNFRVEGDTNDSVIRTQASQDNVGMGGVPASTVERLHIIGTSQDVSKPLVRFQTNNDDADTAPIIEFYRNSTSIEAGNQLGMIRFSGNNTSGDKETYGSINVQIDSGAVADSTSMQFKVKRSGVEVDNFRIRYSEVVVNEDSVDCDFRVETNANIYGFHVDAALDTVGIGGIGASDVALHVFDDGNQDVLVRLETDDNSNNKSPALEFYKNSAADINDYIMAIDSYGLDDASNKSMYSRIATYIEDETALTENAVIIFQVAEAGSMRNNIVMGSTLVTVNGSSRNVDFRVLADDGSKNIYSDAGINAVGIQEQPTTGLADNNPALQVNGSISSKCAIVTKTSATVDLSTRVSNELIGQLYVLTSTSAKTFTVPTSCTQGDWFRVLTTGANGMNIVSTGGASLNGATPASLTRNALNEIYTVVAIADNKWICTSN